MTPILLLAISNIFQKKPFIITPRKMFDLVLKSIELMEQKREEKDVFLKNDDFDFKMGGF